MAPNTLIWLWDKCFYLLKPLFAGLCGVYDGDPSNDLMFRNGRIYQFSTRLHSWSFPAEYCADWRYVPSDNEVSGSKSSDCEILVPTTRCSTLGDRAFPAAAARAWNSLPCHVRDMPSLLAFRHNSRLYCLCCRTLSTDIALALFHDTDIVRWSCSSHVIMPP